MCVHEIITFFDVDLKIQYEIQKYIFNTKIKRVCYILHAKNIYFLLKNSLYSLKEVVLNHKPSSTCVFQTNFTVILK